MHITQIVFSPTGGTQRVVDCLTAAWGAPAARIDLTDPAVEQADLHLGQTDLAVIAAPAYEGRVPFLASRRLARVQADGTPCVIVGVYGNRAYEDTLVELRDLAAAGSLRDWARGGTTWVGRGCVGLPWGPETPRSSWPRALPGVLLAASVTCP